MGFYVGPCGPRSFFQIHQDLDASIPDSPEYWQLIEELGRVDEEHQKQIIYTTNCRGQMVRLASYMELLG